MKKIDYFIHSQNNLDEIIDLTNEKGSLVVNCSQNESPTSLMLANSELLDLISAYKVLNGDSDLNKDESINIVLDKIISILRKTEKINYSPFCAYFQVVGYSYNSYIKNFNNLTLKENRELIKKILDCYLKNRHGIYLYHGYSNTSLQVCSDLSSSRRKGKMGISQMEEILLPYGIKHIRCYDDLSVRGNWYLLPDKGDRKEFEYYLLQNDIKFEFRHKRDNKLPDMLLKINNDSFIVEHKLTNGTGGSQNAEINEIIQFVSYNESNANIHYVSCLQGDYFKKLNIDNKEPKVKIQYKNIINNLSQNKNNFFVNGNGFDRLIKDYVL